MDGWIDRSIDRDGHTDRSNRLFVQIIYPCLRCIFGDGFGGVGSLRCSTGIIGFKVGAVLGCRDFGAQGPARLEGGLVHLCT